MKKSFQLINEDTDTLYGIMSFNGKFVFVLNDEIDLETWNKIGFIPLSELRRFESEDLFRHLNSRLPIPLRNKSNKEKIDFISRNGLKVASDNFYLKEVQD